MSDALPERSLKSSRLRLPQVLPVELQRDQFQQQLDAARDATIVVLEAPSGYGKTTALAHWSRVQERSVVWLALQEDSRDTRLLLRDLALALEFNGIALPHWKSCRLGEMSREHLVNAIAQDINDSDDDLILVLDGGEWLGDDAARSIHHLVNELGEGHQLIIAQHEASAFNSLPYLAKAIGVQLSAGSLAFTRQEAREAAAQLGMSSDAAEQAHQTYQGWPIGIMLALRTHNSSIPLQNRLLVENLIRNLPDDVATALPQLAVADTWSVIDAQALGITMPANWLSTLQRQGFPLTPVSDGKYLPHSILRQTLADRLREDPVLWQRLNLVAAHQAEAAGQVHTAMRHFVEAGQFALAVALAESLVPRWYRTADWLLAREALAILPSTSLTALLRSLLSVALLETGEPQQAVSLAQEQLRLAPTAMAHFTLCLAAHRAVKPDEMLQHINQGLAVATEQRDVIQLLRMKTGYLESQGEYKEAERTIDEAIARADAIGDSSLKLASFSIKAHSYVMRNEYLLARQAFELAYEAGIKLGFVHRLMPVVDQLASLYQKEGRLGEAATILEEFLVLCQATYPLGRLFTETKLALIRFVQGREEEGHRLARGIFEEAIQLENFNLAGQAMNLFFFWELFHGHFKKAETALFILQSLLGEPDDSKIYYAFQVYTSSAYLSYLKGHFDNALSDLEKSKPLAITMYKNEQAREVILRSQILWERGALDETQAESLRQSMNANPHDIFQLRCIWPFASPVLHEFVRRGWQVEFVSQVISNCTEAATQKRLAVEIDTFGGFRFRVEGQPIQIAYASAQEMLSYRGHLRVKTADYSSISDYNLVS